VRKRGGEKVERSGPTTKNELGPRNWDQIQTSKARGKNGGLCELGAEEGGGKKNKMVSSGGEKTCGEGQQAIRRAKKKTPGTGIGPDP